MRTLKCDARLNPLGVASTQPGLSWRLASPKRGQVQTAYQVLVASTPQKLSPTLADCWDSGKVFSGRTLHIAYAGKPLRSAQRVYWKVRAWDAYDQPSSFSEPAWWEMALLDQGDWRASWITRPHPRTLSESELFEDDPAPLFRHEFSLGKPIQRARLYVSGLGYYEARLNGQRVGDHLLDPGWTSYSLRVLYSTYDVTGQLRRGRNALGIMLGNGWFNPLPLRMWNQLNLREHLTIGRPRLILHLSVEFTDGTSQTIASDETWRVTSGPILRNSIYLGETYDARKELPGWDCPGFDDTRWELAIRATNSLGPLWAQEAPPIRLTQTLKPARVTQPKPGTFIFDFGQNFAGCVRVTVKGPVGARVRMRSGELLYPDGTLNGMTAVCGQIKQGGPTYRYEGIGAPRTAFQEDEYVLKGDGAESYRPRFTFHGFRYVELTAASGDLAAIPRLLPGPAPAPGCVLVQGLEGLRLNADVAAAGSFECSNDQFNRIQKMVRWTELSNLFSVESDCPHREKFGYGGDIVAASEMALFNFDLSTFYAKAVRDLADAARPNGGMTETAPFVGLASDGLGGEAGPVGWGTAFPVLQWQLYQHYGDRRLLEEQYPATKAWMAFLKSCARDGILDNGISDHESIAPKPRALTGTAFYYLNASLSAQIARALGLEADRSEAESLAASIRAAFNRKFLQPGTGRYASATQACQAFALYLGLVSPEEQHRASEVLLHDILDANQGHLTTGIFGTKYLLNVLDILNRPDVAYTIVNQRTFPGWGYMLESGATTLWEHWAFSDNTYSHNHPMFGSVSEWFYKSLAGINAAPGAVGFNRIILKPHPLPALDWVRASYDSAHGKILSEWSQANGRFEWRVRVPIGVTAMAFVPAVSLAQVTESGSPLGSAPEVGFPRFEDGCAVVQLASGNYDFVSTLPRP